MITEKVILVNLKRSQVPLIESKEIYEREVSGKRGGP